MRWKASICKHTPLKRPPTQLADLPVETANGKGKTAEFIYFDLIKRQTLKQIIIIDRLALASCVLEPDLRCFSCVFIYTARCDFELFVLFLNFHLFLFQSKVYARESVREGRHEASAEAPRCQKGKNEVRWKLIASIVGDDMRAFVGRFVTVESGMDRMPMEKINFNALATIRRSVYWFL